MGVFNISIVSLLDWCVEVLLPSLFGKLMALQIPGGPSLLGFSVAITILCIVIGAILLRV